MHFSHWILTLHELGTAYHPLPPAAFRAGLPLDGEGWEESRCSSSCEPISRLHLGISMGRHILLVCLVALTQAALAEQKPLWELGFGLAPITFPNYRGSDEQSAYVLPLPYFIFRGDRFKAGTGRAACCSIPTASIST